jgi:hypothetical protein
MASPAITISIQQCRLLTFRPAGFESLDIMRFEEMAAKLGVSSTVCTDPLLDTAVLEALASMLGPPKPNQPREIVLLFGAYLEEQISLAAQYLLIIGYPIFLVRDLIVARDRELSHIHDNRLSQAGAVATTSQQLIYEWAASETDLVRKELLSGTLFQAAPR